MAHFVQFLTDLFDSGHVRVPLARHAPVDFHSLAAAEILCERERRLRLELAATAPDYRPETALLGAKWMYLACQHFVDRGLPADELQQALAGQPEPQPDHVYSLDLTLCFLPDLIRHARQLADGDPLTEVLTQLATAWPLSSVGAADVVVGNGAPGAWFDQRALRQLYLDRIVLHDDASRLTQPAVRARLRLALGAYPHELAGEGVAAALETAGSSALANGACADKVTPDTRR